MRSQRGAGAEGEVRLRLVWGTICPSGSWLPIWWYELCHALCVDSFYLVSMRGCEWPLTRDVILFLLISKISYLRGCALCNIAVHYCEKY